MMPPSTSSVASLAAAAATAALFSMAYPLDGSVEAFSPGLGNQAILHPAMAMERNRRHCLGLFQGQSGVMAEITCSRTSSGDITSSKAKDDILISSPLTNSNNDGKVIEEIVPSTWNQALHRFFLADVGPPLVVLSISGFLYTRLQLPIPLSFMESSIFSLSIIVWWIQEYFFHRILLHSPFNWIGKSIHQNHHSKTYFHVSIDPPELLLGWLFAAHLMLKSILPWHFCLSATVGYALAGLVYEWSHYIVHTKVKPPSQQQQHQHQHEHQSENNSPITSFLSRLFSQMRDNHIRHHLVDDQYWYAFSVPTMDDLFGTNPDVRDVRAGHNNQKK